ncbi:PD-(D/E)XK nuclease family protein, partial [Yersinia enterocolitica]
LTLPLKEGTISLQGRIDRIDVADYQGQNYLRIIDYKSSDRAVDFTEVYHGIALQMLTYLDIAVTNAAKLVNAPAEAAGMMYFHMHNPFIEYKQELKQEDIEKDMLKEFKMDGWVLDNKAVVEMMDTTLEPGKTSTTIPVNYVKSGDFGSRSKVLSEQEFNVLRGFVRKQYQQGGNLILQGDVAINPYQLDSKTPCQFCD